MTAWTGQLGQDNRDRTSRTVQPDLDKTAQPEQDSKDERGGTGELETRCWDRTAEEDSRDRTASTGKRGQCGQNMRA